MHSLMIEARVHESGMQCKVWLHLCGQYTHTISIHVWVHSPPLDILALCGWKVVELFLDLLALCGQLAQYTCKTAMNFLFI